MNARDFILKAPQPKWEIYRSDTTRDGQIVFRFIMFRYNTWPHDAIAVPDNFTDADIEAAVGRLFTRLYRADAADPLVNPGEAERTLWLKKHGLLDATRLLEESENARDFILKQPVDATDAQQCFVRGIDPVAKFEVFFDRNGEEAKGADYLGYEKMPYAEALELVRKLETRFHGRGWKFSIMSYDTNTSDWNSRMKLESVTKDFIMQAPQEPLNWEVHSVVASAGDRLIIFRYRDVAVGQIAVPDNLTDADIDVALSRLRRRLYRAEVQSPLVHHGDKERAPVCDCAWWLEKHGLLDATRLLEESVARDFITNLPPNKWIFKAGGSGVTNMAYRYIQIWCGEHDPVFEYVFDTSKQGDIQQHIARMKAALEKADRISPFNPNGIELGNIDVEFRKWAKQMGILAELGIAPQGWDKAETATESINVRDFIRSNRPDGYLVACEAGVGEQEQTIYIEDRSIWTYRRDWAKVYRRYSDAVRQMEKEKAREQERLARGEPNANWKNFRVEPVSSRPPVPPASESLARDFIMANRHPAKWGDLEPDDVVWNSDTGSVCVVTEQRKAGFNHDANGKFLGHLEKPKTYYEEYHPAYAYAGTKGSTHLESREAAEPIIGRLLGKRSELPADLWNLMRKLYRDAHKATPYPSYWPPVQEGVDTKKWLMRQPVPPDWQFKVIRSNQRGFNKYVTRIYFKGAEVAKAYSAQRPIIDKWRWWLNKAHAVSPFVETPENTFWDWLRLKHRKTLYWRGLKPLNEADEHVNVRNFIQKFGNTWAFKEQRNHDTSSWHPTMVKIFCNGVLVGGFIYRRGGPDSNQSLDYTWMRDMLQLADQKELFVPGQGDFWAWAHRVRIRLTPPDWSAAQYALQTVDYLNRFSSAEESLARDFIMEQPRVADVCREFGLQKTADEYKDGEPLWAFSATIRFQSFKGEFPLTREFVYAAGGTTYKALEVVVVYYEESWAGSGKYSLRIDVTAPGMWRRRKISRNGEEEVAVQLQKRLRTLKFLLGQMRTSNAVTLNRTLSAHGFRSESKEEDPNAQRILESVDIKKWVMDRPTVAAVAEKWGLKLQSHWEGRDTDHTSFTGFVKLSRPVQVRAQLVHYTVEQIEVHVVLTRMTFNTLQDRPVRYIVKFDTKNSWKQIDTSSELELELADDLNLCMVRFTEMLTRVKATTLEQLDRAIHRWLNRGWPRL